MRPSFFACAFLCVAATACGGRIDEAADSPAPAPGTNGPASTSGGDGCTRACDRMTKACAAVKDASGACLRSCRSDLGDDPDAARRYAACIESLSCAEIERGATMDYGPLGECLTRARRGP